MKTFFNRCFIGRKRENRKSSTYKGFRVIDSSTYRGSTVLAISSFIGSDNFSAEGMFLSINKQRIKILKK